MRVMLQHVSVPRPPGEESARIARQFYADVVGLVEKPVPIGITHLDLVWFKLGEEAELHVFSQAEHHPKSGQHFCLSVEDVESIKQALTQNGYETWMPEEIPGRPRFFCRDPFENLIEFTQITDDYLKYQSGD